MSPNKALRTSALALLVSVSSPVLTATQVPNSGPALTIEDAIDISKRCVIERDIRLVGSYIESARFVRKGPGDRGPFWQVDWAYSREIKGGKVSVAVFDDRTCEITHGK